MQRYSAPMRSMIGEIVGRVDVYSDITESRRLYTQLLNSEKLRATDEMASGAAHDFNNLLASIFGQIELLHPEELKPGAREAIDTIRQSALDGARIVCNLQGLTRPHAETPSTTADLNKARYNVPRGTRDGLRDRDRRPEPAHPWRQRGAAEALSRC